MSPEDRLLFACARPDFSAARRSRVLAACTAGPLDWDALAATAERHGVAPLVWEHLRLCGTGELGLPERAAERFEACRRDAEEDKERAARKIAAALSGFAALGIDVMLLKGAALDLLVYDRPWTRSRDVDMILRCQRGTPLFERSRDLVRTFYPLGLECDYFGHHDMDMSGALRIDFAGIWQRVRPIDARGQKAYVMSAEDLLLSLCINACRKRYFRLKTLCDIAESAARLPDLSWDALIQRTREARCEGIVYTALLAARETVGCDWPDSPLESLGVAPARAAALRLLVSSFLRRGTLASLYSEPARAGGRRFGGDLFLPYASFRGDQVLRSIWRALRPAYPRRRARPA
ncbi:MAG TPA: nucleotidyltransferase family protein [Thermoanaerobaculia bacterium]|nr:nucleotidyltransferase family protein [Thermoanaerobaculia bacterium]